VLLLALLEIKQAEPLCCGAIGVFVALSSFTLVTGTSTGDGSSVGSGCIGMFAQIGRHANA
jgi:hypothetical protein